jgi:hypothetical protein
VIAGADVTAAAPLLARAPASATDDPGIWSAMDDMGTVLAANPGKSRDADDHIGPATAGNKPNTEIGTARVRLRAKLC